MASSRTSRLRSVRRLRQIGVDEARRRLADAHRAREASRQALEALRQQAAGLEERERAILAADGTIKLDALAVARRYRAWLAREVQGAATALERAELNESQARVQLESSVRACNVVSRLLEREELEARSQQLRSAQNQLDDQGALRFVATSRATAN